MSIFHLSEWEQAEYSMANVMCHKYGTLNLLLIFHVVLRKTVLSFMIHYTYYGLAH
jgi:hypothetical protein